MVPDKVDENGGGIEMAILVRYSFGDGPLLNFNTPFAFSVVNSFLATGRANWRRTIA